MRSQEEDVTCLQAEPCTACSPQNLVPERGTGVRVFPPRRLLSSAWQMLQCATMFNMDCFNLKSTLWFSVLMAQLCCRGALNPQVKRNALHLKWRSRAGERDAAVV